MLWYYLQHGAMLAIDATLFLLIAIRLLTPPAQSGTSENRARNALVFVCTAIGFLLLLHLSHLGLDLGARSFGGPLWRWIPFFSSALTILLYGGFGISMGLAAIQFSKVGSPRARVEQPSGREQPPHRESAGHSDTFGGQPTEQQMDWGYLWKQLRIGFFRLIGVLLLLGAAPVAFVQQIPGVGIMALATGLGCLWLGFHPKSPLAIKYASLAEDETPTEGP